MLSKPLCRESLIKTILSLEASVLGKDNAYESSFMQISKSYTNLLTKHVTQMSVVIPWNASVPWERSDCVYLENFFQNIKI